MRKILWCLLLVSGFAWGQQSCVCTAGCKIASDPFPAGTGSPTSCTVYKGGVLIGTGATVASSTIPLTNATTCLPPSSVYVAGPVGSVACLVTIPAQPAGSVTLTATATSAAGESVQSAPFVFVSVAALPTVPTAPTGIRVSP